LLNAIYKRSILENSS